MEDWQEDLRDRVARISEYCHAHPKETVETVLLAVLLLFAACWYASDDEETLAVQPKEAPVEPKKEKNTQGTRVTVKGAELAEENAELTNPFSFEHETRAQMAALPPKSTKDDKQEKEKAEKQNKPGSSSPPVPAHVPMNAPTARETSNTSLQEPAAPPLVLKGVAISATDAMAVVIEYGQRRFVHIGDSVAGWTVTAIDRDSVTLDGDDGAVILRLPSH